MGWAVCCGDFMTPVSLPSQLGRRHRIALCRHWQRLGHPWPHHVAPRHSASVLSEVRQGPHSPASE